MVTNACYDGGLKPTFIERYMVFFNPMIKMRILVLYKLHQHMDLQLNMWNVNL